MVLIFLLAALVARPAAQTNTATAKITSAAIWEPGSNFLASATKACRQDLAEARARCFIDEMAKAGAPREAIEFSRRLYAQNGAWGVLWEFQAVGPVDMAKVHYPMRDGERQYAAGARNYGLLLVNGNPAIVDVDDLKQLDQQAMERDEGYQRLKRQFPGLKLWAGARGGTAFEPVTRHPNGGLSFDMNYFLNPTRPAGAWLSGAHFSWNFDATGKFLGTNFTGGAGLLPD
jgi:hypothetical protein